MKQYRKRIAFILVFCLNVCWFFTLKYDRTEAAGAPLWWFVESGWSDNSPDWYTTGYVLHFGWVTTVDKPADIPGLRSLGWIASGNYNSTPLNTCFAVGSLSIQKMTPQSVIDSEGTPDGEFKIRLNGLYAEDIKVSYLGDGHTEGTVPEGSFAYPEITSAGTYGVSTELGSADGLKKKESRFKGWGYNGHIYQPGETYTANITAYTAPLPGDQASVLAQVNAKSPVFTAVWDNASRDRTVRYEANGAFGSMTDSNLYWNDGIDQAQVLENSFSRDGWTFIGWNTESNGSGTDYSPGDRIVMEESVTLYAQWSKTARVTYHANHGTGEVPVDETYYPLGDSPDDCETIRVPGAALTRDGYRFNGWNTKEEGTGDHYDVGAGLLVDDDIDLYAEWSALLPLTITGVDTLQKVYDGTDTWTGKVKVSGTKTGDDVRAAGTGGKFDSAGAGKNKTITLENVTLTGADADKYYLKENSYYRKESRSLSVSGGEILRRPVTVIPCGLEGNLVWGETLPKFDFRISEETPLASGESREVLGTPYFRCVNDQGEPLTVKSPVGKYKYTMGGLKNTNYLISYEEREVLLSLPDMRKVTVTYLPNGGTGNVPVDEHEYYTTNVAEAVSQIIILGGTIKRPGYIFKGWSTDKDGSGPVYQPGDFYHMTDNTVFYAVWEKVECGQERPSSDADSPQKGGGDNYSGSSNSASSVEPDVDTVGADSESKEMGKISQRKKELIKVPGDSPDVHRQARCGKLGDDGRGLYMVLMFGLSAVICFVLLYGCKDRKRVL